MNKKTAHAKPAVKKAQPKPNLGAINDLITAHTAMLEASNLNHPPHNDCITKAKEAIANL